jgi:hypothetical protein
MVSDCSESIFKHSGINYEKIQTLMPGLFWRFNVKEVLIYLVFLVGVAYLILYLIGEHEACERRGGVTVKSTYFYECVRLERK